ncbi:MAG: hypothetical protein GX205_07920 [Firmicutes bacterium]|jgi:hypothetical protein|nr:hypothetical protein [Bacillota bacterium]
MLRVCILLLALALVLAPPVGAREFVFSDPNGLFQTVIPEEWVYQTQQSSRSLSVFYGPGTSNLAYFEVLEPVSYDSPLEYAEYIVSLLAGPGGLTDFTVEEGPDEFKLEGLPAVSLTYTYQAGNGEKQREARLLALIGDGRAVSITISDSVSAFDSTRAVLDTILAEWRWLI